MTAPKGGPLRPVVRLAPLGELNVYPVYEHELNQLEQGSPGSNFLNLAYAMASAALAFAIAIFGTDIPSDRVFNVFVILAVGCGMAAAICALIWKSNYRSNRELVRAIKGRMPAPAGTPDDPAS